jgi:predicted acetyltransferase
MRALLERARGEGHAISTLYPATVSLYRACGYGFGSVFAEWSVALKDLPRAPGAPGVSIEPFEDGAAVDECYQAFASQRNGLPARHPEWWKTRVLFSHDTPQYRYLVRENGAVTGWIVYTIAATNTDGWRNRINARDLFWTTPAAARTLLSLLSHHRSTVETLGWVGPPVEPLADLFDEDRPELKSTFRSMIRLVDVPAAFERRGYDPHVSANVTIGVDDPFFAENAGPWEIAVSNGSAKVVTATNAAARAGASTWASIWAAELLPVDAARQGRLEATDAALAELTAMFAGPAPWTGDFY